MTEQKDTYAIVLLGGMNPRIHHPSWYRFVNLFNEEEADLAIEEGKEVHDRKPNSLQIETPKVTIICQDNRWEIRTFDPNQVQRIQDITSKLFDEIVPSHTYHGGWVQFHLPKGDESNRCRQGYLASVIVNAPLGTEEADHAMSGELTLRRSFDEYTVVVSVRPAPDDKRAVLCFHNFEISVSA